MNITSIIQYTSAATTVIPVYFVLKFWINKNTVKGFRENLIGIHVCLFFVAQIIMLYLAFNGHSNITVMRIFIYSEILLLGYFFFSYQFKGKIFRSIFTIALTLILLAVDYTWGEFGSNPIELFMVESLAFTILGTLAIPEITMERDYENGFYYFIFAILLYSVNNLIGRGMIQLAPSFSLNVNGVATIIKHLLIAKAFYIFIKSE